MSIHVYMLTYLLTYLLTEDPHGQTGTDVALHVNMSHDSEKRELVRV